MPTSLSKLLQEAQWSGSEYVIAHVPEDWMQGRSIFGGLQIAVAASAMRKLVPDVPLRTLQATLIAPLSGKLRVAPTLLRSGKNATHVEARFLNDDGSTALVCIGVFGAKRASIVNVTPTQPEVSAPSPIKLPYIPGMTPAFTQHFDAWLLRGAFPFTGSATTENVFQANLRDEGPFGEAHLIALSDYVPPLGLSHLSQPAPGSTLTWMLELLVDDFSQLPLEGYRIDAQLVAARDGYTSQAVKIWGPAGQPLAISNQSMMVFG